MTILLQVSRRHGMSPVEEAAGGGGKHACAIDRGGEPTDADGSNQLAYR